MSTTEEQIVQEMEEDTDVPANVDPETGEILEPDAEQQAQTEEAAAPRSQKEIDQLTKRLESEADRHAKRVAEIMGDDFALLVPSPVDWTPGFIFNVPEMHPTPEAVAALHALLGEVPPADYPDDPGRQACDVCLGTSKLKTGSLDPNEGALPCRFCMGHGWIGEGNPKVQPLQLVPPVASENGAQQQPNALQVADRWGRPFGHPHYGLEPAYVGA